MKKSILVVFLLIFTQSSFAQLQYFGEWAVGELDKKSGMFAGTGNDSGGLLSQYCYLSSQDCYWTMSNGSTKCEDEESYPAMVNADGGAFHIDMYCYKAASGVARMAFKNFSLIDGAIKKSKSVSIVVPLAGGGFRVTRFLLNGADAAIATMRQRFADQTGRSTRDVTL